MPATKKSFKRRYGRLVGVIEDNLIDHLGGEPDEFQRGLVRSAAETTLALHINTAITKDVDEHIKICATLTYFLEELGLADKRTMATAALSRGYGIA